MNVTLKYCLENKVIHYNEKHIPINLSEVFGMAQKGTVIEVIDRVDNLLTLNVRMPLEQPVPA